MVTALGRPKERGTKDREDTRLNYFRRHLLETTFSWGCPHAPCVCIETNAAIASHSIHYIRWCTILNTLQIELVSETRHTFEYELTPHITALLQFSMCIVLQTASVSLEAQAPPPIFYSMCTTSLLSFPNYRRWIPPCLPRARRPRRLWLSTFDLTSPLHPHLTWRWIVVQRMVTMPNGHVQTKSS